MTVFASVNLKKIKRHGQDVPPSGAGSDGWSALATWPGPASAPVPKHVAPPPGERSPAPSQRAACLAGGAHAEHESNPCHTPESAEPLGPRASLARCRHDLMTSSPPSPAGSPCQVGKVEMLRLPPTWKPKCKKKLEWEMEVETSGKQNTQYSQIDPSIAGVPVVSIVFHSSTQSRHLTPLSIRLLAWNNRNPFHWTQPYTSTSSFCSSSCCTSLPSPPVRPLTSQLAV